MSGSLHLCRVLWFILALLLWSTGSTAAPTGRRFDLPLTSRLAGITPGSYSNYAALNSQQVGIGDLDRDGYPDLTSPLGDSLLVHSGRPDGTLGSPRAFHTPGGAHYSAITDLDRDGFSDIAWAGPQGSGTLFGDGSGTAWTSQLLSSRDALGLAAADFDGDHIPDVAILSSTGTYHTRVFLSRPARSFQAVDQAIDSLSAATAVRVADIDLDGRADLVIGNRTLGCASVLVSRGDGTFLVRRLSDVSERFDVGDVDGDGRVDLVHCYGYFLKWVRGLGDGTFGIPQTLPLFPNRQVDVAIGDLDGDGIADLTATTSIGQILTRRGLGGGSFEAPRVLLLARRLAPISLVDLNRDERLDLIAMSPTSYGMFVALGDGAGGFLGRATTAPVPSIRHLASGDFDEDGAPDLAVVRTSPYQIGIFLARPGRTFESLPFMSLDANYILKVADLDHDGHQDLVVSMSGYRVGVLCGNGDGTFRDPVTTACPASAITVGDVTNDGHQDVVAARADTVRILPGLGDGTFGPAMIARASSAIRYVRIGDLNGDGIHDLGLLLTLWDWGGMVQCGVQRLLGDGAGSWLPQPIMDLGWVTGSAWLAIGDTDRDGRDDMVVRRDDRVFTIDQGPGGAMILGPSMPWSAFDALIDLVDYDGDGLLDVWGLGSGGCLLARGGGTGSFDAPLGVYGSSASEGLADFDRDGRLDLYGLHFWDSDPPSTGDSLFVYFGRDDVAPGVRIVEPGPGALLHIGQTASVIWECEDCADLRSAEVYLSRRGCAGPFEKLSVQDPSTGSFAWGVDGSSGDSIAFKVVVRDSAANSSFATTGPHLLAGALAVDPSPPSFPFRAALSNLRPNPTGSSFQVTIELPAPSRVTLTLHDVQGRRLATLFDGSCGAGRTERHLELPASAQSLHSGLHFLRLTTAAGRDVARIVLLGR